MYLLDTNVVSEFRRIDAGRGNDRVAEWARTQRAEDQFLSALTIFEIERGILAKQRRDAPQATALRRWMTVFVEPTFGARILPVDRTVALRAATLHIPDPAPFADSLIAATAIVHGLTLVTRNARDFAFPGLAVLNPWEL